MRKLIVLIIVLLITTLVIVGIMFMIHSDEGTDLNDTYGAVTDFNVSKSLALEIGNAILNDVYGKIAMSNMEISIKYIESKNYYIVSKTPSPGIPDLGYHVAISKLDGRILKVWS